MDTGGHDLVCVSDGRQEPTLKFPNEGFPGCVPKRVRSSGTRQLMLVVVHGE